MRRVSGETYKPLMHVHLMRRKAIYQIPFDGGGEEIQTVFWRRPTVRTALPCRLERRGCLARVPPLSQAEHGAAWRSLVLDRRRKMGEGSA